MIKIWFLPSGHDFHMENPPISCQDPAASQDLGDFFCGGSRWTNRKGEITQSNVY